VLHDLFDDPLQTQFIDIDDDACGFSIERVSLCAQGAQASFGIGHLKQRATSIPPQTVPEEWNAGAQVYAAGARPQQFASVRLEHRTAACRDHSRARLHQLGDHLGFEFAKRPLACGGEDRGDRSTLALLDDLVAVREGRTEPGGQCSADGGLAGPGQSDQ
jgi:hypothetical protein